MKSTIMEELRDLHRRMAEQEATRYRLQIIPDGQIIFGLSRKGAIEIRRLPKWDCKKCFGRGLLDWKHQKGTTINPCSCVMEQT